MLQRLHFIFLFNLLSLTILGQANQWIRINQLGYLPNYPKVAVWVSKDPQVPSTFELIEVKTQKVVFQSKTLGLNGALLLTHVGVGEKRTDKFYDKLDALITELQNKGYKFEKLK